MKKKEEKKAVTKKITEKVKKKVVKKKPKTVKKTTVKKKEAKKVTAKKKEKKPTKKAVKKETKKVKVEKKPKKIVKKVVAKPEKELPLKAAKKVKIRKITEKPKYPSMPWEALPTEYGEDSITLMTVDPKKLFAYWEVGEDTIARYGGILNIRVYDVTGIDFDGMNANSYFDIPVNEGIGSWYIDVSPETEFIADIGVINPQGIFITIARSNKVSTPRVEITEEGVLPQELYKTGLHVGY
ncbi:MAG: DUF4912 domain-containing protein [Nitrospirae bacterium]|nr:DUF4912 domain-containing protein [Nitrospirota bacterium]